MKKLLLLIVVSSLGMAGLGSAQCNTDPNEIGIFWSPQCTECVTCLDYFGGMTTAYIVLINPTQEAGISGFEFSLVNADGSFLTPPPSDFLAGYTLPPAALNVATPPEFAVGMDVPLPQSPCITLVQMNVLVFDYAPWCFGVKPSSETSIPGEMVYSDGSDPGLLVPMYPNNGPDAPDFALACLNSPNCPPHPIVVEERSWGTIKSLYR